jgi:hypothetical protein
MAMAMDNLRLYIINHMSALLASTAVVECVRVACGASARVRKKINVQCAADSVTVIGEPSGLVSLLSSSTSMWTDMILRSCARAEVLDQQTHTRSLVDSVSAFCF